MINTNSSKQDDPTIADKSKDSREPIYIVNHINDDLSYGRKIGEPTTRFEEEGDTAELVDPENEHMTRV